ncbi:hypothetical protein ORI20_27210 [Mycobacterium sp. CVI_P3]|uniref:Glycosyltransferase RgtA/B/C/D-like domain-containing protein n=1 Tax=Mycobacterium pinniadriaticum TaxID=2994102 RepID=A0ABT3SLI3_9MYCO|nr:hypothetical protein [Mycobacterium pinniadriaticum]MCX2933964.1 hypothetical protein [Mycobacterium pinniadriaticum]MCX2940386.1 hypothetical protein [Mycobacterium pinniadriaticum]
MPWGLLPVGLPLGGLLVLAGGTLILPRPAAQRLLAGALVTLGAVVVAVVGLGTAGRLTGPLLLAVLAWTTLAVLLVAHRRAVRWWRLPWRSCVSVSTLPVLLVALAAVVLTVVTAYYLPVWQWDALGYHLPYVNFALQRATFADIPSDVAYLSSYPHIVEDAFIAWRAMLPDDRLVELAHLMFGLLGALAIAAIARGSGARGAHAVAAGAAWLTLPAVFLQLPSNYTDVASAALLLSAVAFVVAPMHRTQLLLAGIAIGLFLGSKPNALIAGALLLAVLTVRGHRAGRRGWIATAWLAALLFGAPTYAVNIARHHNPVWPVRIDVGPLHLPGTRAMSALLESGAAAPHLEGPLLSRVVRSWTTIAPQLPVFDMRIGGLGLVFLVALPVALVRAVRTRSPAVWLCFAAALATPDPAVARYVLGFAGLVLAFAVPAVDRLGRRGRQVVFAAAAVAAAQGLWVAYPGLTGEGPPLGAYVHMTPEQRRAAVGAAGPPGDVVALMGHLPPGAVTAFDSSVELPYLAWPPDLSRRAIRIPDDATPAQARALLTDPDVTVLMVGDDSVTARLARSDVRFRPVFGCGPAPCTVYLRG